ncbi:MAG: hypothetical protein HY400_03995 [Elusimicrobia bacterium]|nr:hypothetical protein [Elusimicrobiota bacterium]
MKGGRRKQEPNGHLRLFSTNDATSYGDGSSVVWWALGAYYDLAQYKSASGWDTNSKQVDPQFLSTDPASPDFLKLTPGSPAIDAGTIVSGYHCPISGDIDPTQTGCKLWYGSAPDIGAFEYNPGLPKDKLPPAKPKGLTLR